MYQLSSGVNSFSDLYDIHDYGNLIGSQGDDIILGGASHSVGIAGGIGDDVIYGNSIDSLRYDLEEELANMKDDIDEIKSLLKELLHGS